MLKKNGSFFADWQDPQGHRRRKAFPTKRAALNHQKTQRALSAAKKAR
jgi:hypothetical protein